MNTATRTKPAGTKTAAKKPVETDTTASTLVAMKEGIDGPMTVMDVRGWNVTGTDGAAIGKVDGILLDAMEKKPRYLTVVRENVKGRLLLPIGLGTPEPATRLVKMTTLQPEVLKNLPVLNAEVVTPDFERHVFSALTGKTAQTMSAREWYADPVFNTAKLQPQKKVETPTA